MLSVNSTLGIIAGGGRIPVAVARAAVESGRGVFVIGIKGAADPDIAEFPHAWIRIAAVGRATRLLRRAGVRDLVIVGAVTRPDFRQLRPDRGGIKLLARILFTARSGSARFGDDRLLRLIARHIEIEGGFRIVAPESILKTLLPEEGVLGRHSPGDAHRGDIRLAAQVAGALGAVDVGQGAVVCRGTVLAVEAAEGTDHMLRRIPDLNESLRGTPAARAGVFLKRPKPGQDRRLDLPAIGAETVTLAADAGLAGIALEAGGVLMLDPADVIRRADSAGMFLAVLPARVLDGGSPE